VFHDLSAEEAELIVLEKLDLVGKLWGVLTETLYQKRPEVVVSRKALHQNVVDRFADLKELLVSDAKGLHVCSPWRR
jgi:hypothetical protein